MPKKDLLILGAGGFGLAVAEAAELTGQWDKIVFADDRWPDHGLERGAAATQPCLPGVRRGVAQRVIYYI